jgi:luciferase family oxidoreductase group 1
VLPLGVLDQSPVRSGGTPADAVHETLELAELADRLGYHRYWLAEHHSTPGLAGSCPEILVGPVAARTSRIRVGTGGVMLTHYSPLKVAEQFRMLETLYPGRIDLGLGRAPGSDGRTARALRGWGDLAELSRYPERVAELAALLRDDVPPGHPLAGVRAMPGGPGAPELWLLGSSDASAACAAALGAAFSFAHFISDHQGAAITRAYRAAFRPSSLRETPRASVAAFVVCAETAAEARRLARSRELFTLRLRTGRPGLYPTVEEAEAYPYAPAEWAVVEDVRRRMVTGTPAEVGERLRALAAEYAADEVVVVTITHDPKARRRSYELVAEALGLPGAR